MGTAWELNSLNSRMADLEKILSDLVDEQNSIADSLELLTALLAFKLKVKITRDDKCYTIRGEEE